MKTITMKDALGVALLTTSILFLTGLVTIPFANKISTDIWQQNVIYMLGRIPVVFFAVAIWFNLGKKNE
jgi:hypothetical protein